MKRLKNFFFSVTATSFKKGVRFLTGDEPTEATMRDLIASVPFFNEVDDTAKETEQGLIKHTTQTQFDAGEDNDAVDSKALAAKPSQIKAAIDAIPAGPAGTNGKSVLNGSGAPVNGVPPTDGDFYIDTNTDTIYGPQTGGIWGAGTSLIGPAGTPGTNGATGATGATGPAGTNGTNGNTIHYGTQDPNLEVPPNGPGVANDFYINTTTNFIFGPKSVNYPAGVSLVGPAGADGVDASAFGYDDSAWIAPVYSVSNFQFVLDTGGGFSINSLSFANVRYKKLGKTLVFSFDFRLEANTSTVTVLESARLEIDIPGGFQRATIYDSNMIYLFNNSDPQAILASTENTIATDSSSTQKLRLKQSINRTANGNFFIDAKGQIIFEIL